MKLNIARVKTGSMVDGPDGPRTVVWLQGCSIRCIGCQNWALWPKETSDMQSLEPAEAARMVLALAKGQPITITGGEPFDQAQVLGPFVAALKSLAGAEPPHIIIYTGYRFEDLRAEAAMRKEPIYTFKVLGTYLALDLADVLVDGEYIERLDNPAIQWRGSANQRPLDLAATRDWVRDHGPEQGMIAVMADWDTPTLEIVGGSLFATSGLLEILGLDEFGIVESIPRCGEFEED